MSQKNQTPTRDQILTAATELIAGRGFRGTTTKDIAAAAGVSEMSLFRCFGSKKALLAAIMERHTLAAPLTDSLREKLTWEPEHDLVLLAEIQYQQNRENEKALLIRFKEKERLAELGIDFKDDPRRLKAFLTEYFEEMQRRGRIVSADSERLAIYFMTLNLGIFCAQMLGPVSDVPAEEEVRFSARCFARGIRA